MENTKKTKRFAAKAFTALMLMVMLLVPVLSACGGDKAVLKDIMTPTGTYPILKDEYIGNFKLTMMAPSHYTLDINWQNNLFFKRMNELTGVDFNFNVFDMETYGTKKPLAITTSDGMPDFFFKALFDKTEVIRYGSQGTIIALEKYIDENMPNLKALMAADPQIAQIITAPDGHIYSLPTVGKKDAFHFVGLPWINQAWLADCGLSMPTTPGEFKDMLIAFKAKYPGRYPMYLSGYAEIYWLLSFFGIDYDSYMQFDKNGDIEFGPNTDRYKAGLVWLNELVREGLLNADFAGSTVQKKWVEGAKNGGDNIGFFIDYAAYAVVGYDNANSYVTLNTVKNDYFGKAMWRGAASTTDGFFVVTKKCQYPEVITRWLDTLYSEEYSKWVIIGKEDVEWKWDDAAHTTWSWLIPANERADYLSRATIQGGGGMPYLELDEAFQAKNSEPIVANNAAQTMRMQSIGFDGFPTIFLKNTSRIKQASVMYADINKFIEEINVKVITGQWTLERAYQDYNTMADRLNIDGYMELFAEGYDIYVKNGGK
ncbi:ABC transporter substrate-binding protein [Clostridia bacterium]|nr:ABC transporter substrate-binding protein [Clostridia bacterium]